MKPPPPLEIVDGEEHYVVERILDFGNVGVQNAELVSELVSELISELLSEFTDDQTEMIKETVVVAVAGTIMAMIAELTGDWVRD